MCIRDSVNGVPCNDIGCRTDVLDGCNKLTGVYMAVRSLSPQVVAMDEIGGEDDIKAVKYCIKSGCAVIGTAHGSGIYAVSYTHLARPYIGRLNIFSRLSLSSRISLRAL